MRTFGRVALALGVLISLTAAFGTVAFADHQRAICEVSAQASAKLEQGYVLSTRLRTTEGRPVNDATVRFYEVVELFGTREMLVATATTDGQGNASAIYLPARTGTHEIVVRFAGRDHFTPAAGRTTLDATVAAPPYRPYVAPLAGLGAAVPYGVGAIVLSVWALIAFAFIGTARGVLRGARDHAKEGDMA